MEKKCRSCGASTEFLGGTLFSLGGLILPSETRFCPRCKLANIFVIEDLGVDGEPSPDLPAFCAKRLRVEKHGGLLEVMCPRCEANMFFVQHSEVSFGDVNVIAESWICECGTTLETAKDSEIA